MLDVIEENNAAEEVLQSGALWDSLIDLITQFQSGHANFSPVTQRREKENEVSVALAIRSRFGGSRDEKKMCRLVDKSGRSMPFIAF